MPKKSSGSLYFAASCTSPELLNSKRCAIPLVEKFKTSDDLSKVAEQEFVADKNFLGEVQNLKFHPQI